MARKSGALTLAIVNDENSPAAAASELVLPIGAGAEQSVAATKSVVLSMIAGRGWWQRWRPTTIWTTALEHLPLRLSDALACDWSAWADSVAGAPAAFVVGRGYGLGCAREIALKVAEVLRVPALGYSAAELRHGPRASITPATPVLVLRQNDQAATAVDDFVRDLDEVGRRRLPPAARRGRCPGSVTAIRFAIRSSCSFRPIALSKRRRAGEASIPTIRPT